MRVKFKFPPPGEKDDFSKDVIRTEWIFKIFGWIVVIGTLRYAAQATGHAAFTFWAFGLTLELGYLAFSFIHNRIVFEIFEYQGKWLRTRFIVNLLSGVIVAWGAWQVATWAVNDVATEIIEFNKASKEPARRPTEPGAPRSER